MHAAGLAGSCSDDELLDVDLRLTPQDVITGRVLDIDGEPTA